jgi:hypothetical protein
MKDSTAQLRAVKSWGLKCQVYGSDGHYKKCLDNSDDGILVYHLYKKKKGQEDNIQTICKEIHCEDLKWISNMSISSIWYFQC